MKALRHALSELLGPGRHICVDIGYVLVHRDSPWTALA